METKNAVRLNKFIAESGICSRREADRYIENGRVQIVSSRIFFIILFVEYN